MTACLSAKKGFRTIEELLRSLRSRARQSIVRADGLVRKMPAIPIIRDVRKMDEERGVREFSGTIS
jgi:hypothetical protein